MHMYIHVCINHSNDNNNHNNNNHINDTSNTYTTQTTTTTNNNNKRRNTDNHTDIDTNQGALLMSKDGHGTSEHFGSCNSYV